MTMQIKLEPVNQNGVVEYKLIGKINNKSLNIFIYLLRNIINSTYNFAIKIENIV